MGHNIYICYSFLEFVGTMSLGWQVDTELLDLKELEKQIAELVDKSNVEEMLKIQLSEFEMVQSMFSNPGELTVDDHSVLADFNDYLEGRTTVTPPHLDFTINLVLGSKKLQVSVNLPLEYPNLEPDIFVRSESLNRNQQHILNADLAEHILNLERGEICICSAIAWLQEKGLDYFDNSSIDISNELMKSSQDCQQMFTRLWIYSHHIYSKSKRREVLDLAHEYNLTGFCLPGRPGIMCIEGLATDCEEWWHKVFFNAVFLSCWLH